VIYVALLRGINVGGNNLVDMRGLKLTFERLGLEDVRTYINSGNVLFNTKRRGRPQLTKAIEAAIAKDFGADVDVLVRTADELRALVRAIPAKWTNDTAMKCDVYFLWPAIDRAKVVDEVPHNPAIEDLRYLPGALVRRVDRAKQSKSPMTKIVGTPIYKQMTARNINTVRKLVALADADASH
jgi:uncharacterized protein (DUF1697 family)